LKNDFENDYVLDRMIEKRCANAQKVGKTMKKVMLMVMVLILMVFGIFSSCDTDSSGTKADVASQSSVQNTLSTNQKTPTDISYSLERYNLIRRAYWVNGQRERAVALPCSVVKPLGYIVLFIEGVGIVGQFVVDGKLSRPILQVKVSE
jgi:uncharacterized protein YxeA